MGPCLPCAAIAACLEFGGVVFNLKRFNAGNYSLKSTNSDGWSWSHAENTVSSETGGQAESSVSQRDLPGSE